ncbi:MULTISPECIES: hypothetical protein [Haloferax]|uniref:Matrixin n=1 Tax=Haloferax marinum TaxID=2666143 RepID=A0A6A8G325_9EURY|nr:MULTISPECIES: hypothetical protein [Haloferax]KAB1196209.1 hypothetical protein Hfx1150_01250 [Haloferax sp. CBA1150]MRW95197.1 hypothetical protein [Haloferax marinum]
MPSPADTRLHSLALAVLVVLSGCAGFSPAPPVAEGTAPDSPADVVRGHPTSNASAVSPPSSDVDFRPARNPWNHTPLVVAIDALDDNRTYAPLVTSAIEYWRSNASGDSEGASGDSEDVTPPAYNPAFVVVPNASDPDVRVSVVDSIESCGAYDGPDAVGCAPLLDAASSVDAPVSVVVADGYDDATTVSVLTHEFGHLLGYTHDDAESHPVMGTHLETTRLPVANASTRAVPFRDETLSVYVDLSNVSDAEREAYDAELDHTLRYYESGADGFTPEAVELTRVSNRSRAQVVVRVVTFREGPSGVRWRRTGESVDDDPAYEWYTGGTILVDTRLGPSLVDWYVGAGVGYLLGANDRAELPPPFRDSDLRDDPSWRGVANETV